MRLDWFDVDHVHDYPRLPVLFPEQVDCFEDFIVGCITSSLATSRLQSLSWSETPRLSVGLRFQVWRRVAGDDPRTDQINDGKGVKRAGVPPAKLSWLPGWLSFCLVVRVCVWFLVLCLFALRTGVGCWVVVSGALVSSLVVGCCPCLPGSGFCAGFRGKGRRPYPRTIPVVPCAHVGLFQVFPGMLAVLERRYRGGLLPFLTASSIF